MERPCLSCCPISCRCLERGYLVHMLAYLVVFLVDVMQSHLSFAVQDHLRLCVQIGTACFLSKKAGACSPKCLFCVILLLRESRCRMKKVLRAGPRGMVRSSSATPAPTRISGSTFPPPMQLQLLALLFVVWQESGQGPRAPGEEAAHAPCFSLFPHRCTGLTLAQAPGCTH